jgi:hypothetical protein
MNSFEAMDRCIGRHRTAVAKALHKSTILVAKWMEPSSDFTDSGLLNPMDRLETIMNTALHEGQTREDATAPILYLANKFNMTVIPLPESVPSLKDIVRQSHRSIKEFGEYISAFSEAIADGKITPMERKHIELEGLLTVQQIIAVIQMMGEEK